MANDPLHDWGTQVQQLNRFYNSVHDGVDNNTHPLVLHLLTACHVLLETAEADVAALRLGNLPAKKDAAIRAHWETGSVRPQIFCMWRREPAATRPNCFKPWPSAGTRHTPTGTRTTW